MATVISPHSTTRSNSKSYLYEISEDKVKARKKVDRYTMLIMACVIVGLSVPLSVLGPQATFGLVPIEWNTLNIVAAVITWVSAVAMAGFLYKCGEHLKET